MVIGSKLFAGSARPCSRDGGWGDGGLLGGAGLPGERRLNLQGPDPRHSDGRCGDQD